MSNVSGTYFPAKTNRKKVILYNTYLYLDRCYRDVVVCFDSRPNASAKWANDTNGQMTQAEVCKFIANMAQPANEMLQSSFTVVILVHSIMFTLFSSFSFHRFFSIINSGSRTLTSCNKISLIQKTTSQRKLR